MDKNVVKNIGQAWTRVNLIAANLKNKAVIGFVHDPESNERAGYPIYRDPSDYYTRVCVLGNRLELLVQTEEGEKVFNIWISPVQYSHTGVTFRPFH